MSSPSGLTYHLVPEEIWLNHQQSESYHPERFADEGFVHCTDGEAFLLDVGNRYYQGDPRSYLVLDVDLDALAAEAIYEDDARRYPHVYGPIEHHAVRRVRRVERSPDGSFVAIGEIFAPAS
jgi:uncharacterized protein (DUF952 family)